MIDRYKILKNGDVKVTNYDENGIINTLYYKYQDNIEEILKLQNIEEYCIEMNSKENSKDVTPILMIHFLNRYISRIKSYSNENLADCLAFHVERAIEVNSIKVNIKRIIFDQSYITYIKKLGYTLKGIIFIKIFSLLCTLKMYKPAARFITMKVN